MQLATNDPEYARWECGVADLQLLGSKRDVYLTFPCHTDVTALQEECVISDLAA